MLYTNSFLKVDEEGSEAAAATGVIIVKETAVMPKRILKLINHSSL